MGEILFLSQLTIMSGGNFNGGDMGTQAIRENNNITFLWIQMI